ncbi:hypothetical protein GJ496_005507 [Pomphorhynchus laevis]|nr:hypothetical protein GJ496_005507 [Pomphorhynchus laevis]
MTSGKATSVIRMLSLDVSRSGLLRIYDIINNTVSVREKLSILHPEDCELNMSLELKNPLPGMCEHHSYVFLAIDAQTIISELTDDRKCYRLLNGVLIQYDRLVIIKQLQDELEEYKQKERYIDERLTQLENHQKTVTQEIKTDQFTNN